MTPLERLHAAMKMGREAAKAGKSCMPASDPEFKELHQEAEGEPNIGIFRDAWRIGWYEVFYSSRS